MLPKVDENSSISFTAIKSQSKNNCNKIKPTVIKIWAKKLPSYKQKMLTEKIVMIAFIIEFYVRFQPRFISTFSIQRNLFLKNNNLTKSFQCNKI